MRYVFWRRVVSNAVLSAYHESDEFLGLSRCSMLVPLIIPKWQQKIDLFAHEDSNVREWRLVICLKYMFSRSLSPKVDELW